MSDPNDPLHPEWDTEKLRQGEMFKADGMARADRNAPESWRGNAELALKYVAERRPKLTSDPVWTVLQRWGVDAPPEPRALGPLMKAACGWGWITPTGEFVLSARPERHRAPIAVYRSELYEVRS